MLGGILALLAAASFAYNSATARRAVLTGSVFQGIAITVPLGVPIFFLAALLFGQLGMLAAMPVHSMIWLGLAGIAHFVWGRYFFYRAQEMLGANLAGSIQQFDLLLSLGLAIVFLGEVLTPLRVLGILLVLIGPALAFGSQRPNGGGMTSGAGARRAFAPQFLPGYIYVGLAALGYGISPTLTRLALRDLGPQASLVGGLIACTAATVAFAILVLVTGRISHIASTNRETLKWFGVASVSVTFSQMLRFAALSLAPVTVVQPIQRLSKLFLFFFSWWMNREHEIFDSRLIIATIVSIIGAAILSVPTDVVLAMADWPPWVPTMLQWQWP
ncbi:MAG: EamA family transporter [Hyphomicrobiaceae bacterium]